MREIDLSNSTEMLKKKIYSLYNKGKRKLIKGCRSFYYNLFYGRQLPLATPLENAVTSWEQKYNVGEVNIPPQTWDEEYLSNKWDFLKGLDELPRYSLLTGYMAYLKQGGAFLDIGCGDGILFEKYQPYGFSFYKGIDISEVAIRKLAEQEIANTEFICANAEYYQPVRNYDAIIFNESLYYFKDPVGAIERIKTSLKENGIIFTSVYEGSSRSKSVNRIIRSRYSILDETKCINNSKTWICLVFNPRDIFE